MKTETENITTSSVCTCTTEDFVKPGKVIITSTFKSTASEYLSLAISRSISTYCLLIIIPIIIFSIIALIFDIRWILVTLIFLFLIAPFIIANIYFSKLLTPQARIALSPKKIRIVSGKYIEIYLVDTEDKVTSTERIQFAQIKDIRQRQNSWVIEIKASPIVGIIIPRQSIIEIFEQQNDCNSTYSSNFFD
ncbi:MAG: hypothetical protein HDT08_02860 [Bacteroidales bacterium]|nr:hypothetical protein [Bacteroidales bacterium]